MRIKWRNWLLLAHNRWRHCLDIIHLLSCVVLVRWDVTCRVILPHIGASVLLTCHLLSVLEMCILVLHSWVTLVECEDLTRLLGSVKTVFIVYQATRPRTSRHGKMLLTIEVLLSVLHHLVLSRMELLGMHSGLTKITSELAHLWRSIWSHIFLFINSLTILLLGYALLTHIINWSVTRVTVIIGSTIELLCDLDRQWSTHLLISYWHLRTKSFTMAHLRVLLLHHCRKLGWHAHHVSLNSHPLMRHLTVWNKFSHIHLLMHLLLG